MIKNHLPKTSWVRSTRIQKLSKSDVQRLLGNLLDRLGRILGIVKLPGHNLDTSWGRLDASWGLLGSSWGVLGTSWAVFGASWGRPETVLERLGDFLGHLGGDFICIKQYFRGMSSWKPFLIRILVDFASKNQARKLEKSLNSVGFFFVALRLF